MSRVDTAANELIEAIIDSEEYREYDRQLAIMKEYPDLKEKIDEFRHENYLMQHSGESDELFDKIDDFVGRIEKLREDPLVDAFLSAELEFCRMVQEINQKIVEAVDFE